MKILIQTFIIYLGIINVAFSSAEVTLNSPIFSENEEFLNISGTGQINISNPCSNIVAGYSFCKVVDDILTVEYPLIINAKMPGSSTGSLDIQIIPDGYEFFTSFKIKENNVEALSPFILSNNDNKSYKIEIQIKLRGYHSFSDPKTSLYLTLSSTDF